MILRRPRLGKAPQKYTEGTIHQTNNYGQCRVVKYLGYERVIIEFLDSGNTKEVGTTALKRGDVRDDKIYLENIIYKIGNVFDTKGYGKVEIIERVTANKFRIKFLKTGSTTIATLSSIREGSLRDPDYFSHIPKELGNSRFVVYTHSDSAGIIRYVGSGTEKRAFDFRLRSKEWLDIFKGYIPTVTVVSNNLTKDAALELEIDLYDKYSDTICNSRRPFVVKKMVYSELSNIFKLNNTGKLEYLDGRHVAGSKTNEGYIRVFVNYKTFMYHRIVFLLANPQDESILNIPHNVVDHIDRDKSNNHPSNLRVVSFAENCNNSLYPVISESGYRNISPVRQSGVLLGFRVIRCLNGKYSSKHFKLKDYKSEQEALCAAYAFREQLIRSGLLSDIIKQNEQPPPISI